MRVLVCTSCRCTLEQIEVANGRAVAICITCESIGNVHEIALGARATPFEQPPARRVKAVKAQTPAQKPVRAAALLDTH